MESNDQIKYSNIAILSTVINFELYAKSALLFPENIKRYVIDGRNGMHGLNSLFYMMKKLKNKNIEWLIMADEDVLFDDETVVFDIINKMKSEGYIASGVRDGGMIKHRVYNPNVINTFFSVLNFKELEKIWNKREIIKNNYIINNEFNDDFQNLKGIFDVNSLFEPYYCFYLWLRRKNKKILFLDAKMGDDEISNLVLYDNKTLLHHTWYARSYGKNEMHTRRIDKLFDLMNFQKEKKNDFEIFKDRSFWISQKIKKNLTKLLAKINLKKNGVQKSIKL